MKIKLPKFKFDKHIPVMILLCLLLAGGAYFYNQKVASLSGILQNLTQEKDKNLEELNRIGAELEELKNQDQVKINKDLKAEVENIQKTYNTAVSTYESLLELKEQSNKTEKLDEQFTDALVMLSKRNYSSASASFTNLSKQIQEERTKIASSFTIPQNVPESSAPPGSGYSRQRVTTEGGSFIVSIVAADLGSTKAMVDTASDGDCSDNCPVLPLATYVSRNGAYAGVNGSYFCPATYPSCSGKTNSFDLLVMNKNKTYFNSGNNVYSGNPAVIFGGGYVRFVGAASEWGRDTGVDGVLSNFPLLLSGGNVAFGGDDDPKKGSKGNRSFVANKGNTAYIGVVHSATVAESARVMKAMGMENALNLDDGGSTALWSGGYKVGPGRDLPNVILFVRK